jgi:hypothetical protein
MIHRSAAHEPAAYAPANTKAPFDHKRPQKAGKLRQINASELLGMKAPSVTRSTYARNEQEKAEKSL